MVRPDWPLFDPDQKFRYRILGETGFALSLSPFNNDKIILGTRSSLENR